MCAGEDEIVTGKLPSQTDCPLLSFILLAMTSQEEGIKV